MHLEDTTRATRPFLVDITPSRVVFSAILAPRGLCDNSKMCVRARSLVRRLLTQTRFLTSDVTYDPCKWTNTVSETGIEPSCVGIGQKLTSVDQKASTTMEMAFPTLRLRIYGFLLNQYMVMSVCCRNFVKRSVGQTCPSNTPI